MLRKLLKYEMENIFKFLAIFYGLAIILGLLTRCFLGIENSFIMDIVGNVCSGATIVMIFNILINNIMRLWVRFKNNLYGDESYLTHTLPVKKANLYLAKIITAVVSLFISILVIGLTLAIAYYSKENLKALESMLLPVASSYNSTIIKIISAFLFIFFLEILNVLQAGYTGIILGHKMNSNKTIFSVMFGYGAYLLVQMFSLMAIFLVALFNKDMLNLFITQDLVSIDMVKLVIGLGIIIYVLTFVIGYIVNLKLFKTGVNVD